MAILKPGRYSNKSLLVPCGPSVREIMHKCQGLAPLSARSYDVEVVEGDRLRDLTISIRIVYYDKPIEGAYKIILLAPGVDFGRRLFEWNQYRDNPDGWDWK